MIEFILSVLFLLFLLFLIPSVVSEDRLHGWVTRVYLSDNSNVDVIYSELDEKRYLVEDFFVSDCTSLSNCCSNYYFVEPVLVVFDVHSLYEHGEIYKEFHGVVSLNLFALHGDIECQVSDGVDSKSIFLFKDAHYLKFRVLLDST